MDSDVQFLQHCADNRQDQVCWEEFIARFHTVIARSVACSYRRFTHGSYPPAWLISELVQEVYLRLIKDDCALLRRFRGICEQSARAYLAQIAINAAGDVLRREIAQKRQSEKTTLDETYVEDEVWNKRHHFALPEGLAERELLRLLAVQSPGDNTKRDVLIFLLHIRGGFTAEEIALSGVFNLQPPTVWSIIIRIRARLRRALEQAA
jgi:DNA-directed RNA polymerase specialized sigma subunit, sigma24 homolog